MCVTLFSKYGNHKKKMWNLITKWKCCKEGATSIVPWEIYQKQKVHTLKEKLIVIDYKSITNRLQKMNIDTQGS